eukprot:m.119195 g.119195  ORF g.119195 m.119195 type:complete len:538 (+) comp19530_c1_seq3:36-1649(+)
MTVTGLLLLLVVVATASATEYPIYGIHAGQANFSDADLQVIEDNWSFLMLVSNQGTEAWLPKSSPRRISTRIVHYKNTWSRDDYAHAETDRANAMAYYAAGRLESPLTAHDTTFTLVKDGSAFTLLPSSAPPAINISVNCTLAVTWIRVGDELMRIVAASAAARRVTVVRGWDGTSAQAHTAGVTVLAPLYSGGHTPNSPGCVDSTEPWRIGGLTYAVDPQTEYGIQMLLDAAHTDVQAGYDGLWLDCFSSDIFLATAMDGSRVQTTDVWNRASRAENATLYTASSFLEAQKPRVTAVYAAFGVLHSADKAPFLYANDMFSYDFPLSRGGNYRLLVADPPAYPRALTGYDIESYGITMQGPCGSSTLEWISLESWTANVQEFIAASNMGLASMCNTGDAGCHSPALESAPLHIRNHYEGFAYASFLLGVLNSTLGRFGVYPVYNATTQPRVWLHPRYSWRLGAPMEFALDGNISKYIPSGGHVSYVRHFEQGVVAVNPTVHEDRGVPLGGTFVDPETGTAHDAVTLPDHTGLILLKA